MAELLQEGWYDAYAESADLHVGKPDENGQCSLSVYISYRVADSGVKIGKYHALIKRNKDLVTDRNGVSMFEILNKRYGWSIEDGNFSGVDMTTVPLRVKVEHSEYNGKTRMEISFVNEPDEQKEREKKDPAEENRLIMEQFGAFMRLTPKRGTPNKTPPVKSPVPSGKVAKKPPTNAKSIKPSSQEEAWEKFLEIGHEDGESKWFELLDEILPGKPQDQYTPEDWGRILVVAEKRAEVPF